jgi:hypothetical protein
VASFELGKAVVQQPSVSAVALLSLLDLLGRVRQFLNPSQTVDLSIERVVANFFQTVTDGST